MKKVLSFVLVVLLVVSIIPTGLLSFIVKAETSTSGITGDCSWSLEDGVLTISGTGVMQDYGLTYDSHNLWHSLVPWGWRTLITDVIIENGVTSIGENAFYRCERLTSITIPDSITYIGDGAFYGCSGLTCISLPDGVTNIGRGVFSGCSGLTSISLPDGVTNIGSIAFSGCSGLTSITIPDSVTSIGYEAFEDCALLTNINIPNSVTSIDNSTFSGCTSLTSISLPDSVTNIGGRAFFGCRGLTSITIPDNVTNIGYEAFEDCASLTSISLPDGVTNIGDSAFPESILLYGYKTCLSFVEYMSKRSNDVVYLDGTDEESIISGKVGNINWNIDKRTGELIILCNGKMVDFTSLNPPWYEYQKYITKIELFDGITSIGNSAFFGCKHLTSISLPDSVTSIGDSAFSGCSGLTCISMPDSVTSIGFAAFFGCTSLTSITIPYKVSLIDSNVFNCCDNLEKIYIYNKKCDIDSYCGLNYNQTIYGFLGSIAEVYAEQIGAEFIDIMTVHSHSYDNACDISCDVCGAMRTITHDYEVASCTVPKTCKICGATDGAALGHTYDEQVVSDKYLKSAASCSSAAVYYKSCECGATGKTTFTSGSKLAHKYDSGKVTKAATCKATGVKTYTCSVCKGTKNETIAKLTTHSYKTTTTKATLTKNGSIVKKCTVCGKVASNTAIKYAKTFKLSTTTYTYNGKVKTPSITVKDSAGKTLKKNTDYTVTYASGRKNVGAYKVIIKMKGKYSGTKTLTFKINPAKTTVSKLTAGKKSITVAITKKSTQVTGYQIQYSTSKTFSKATTKTISSYKTTKYTLKSLSAKKTYYVRVRTYKTVGKTKYYSGWSTYKYVKTK